MVGSEWDDLETACPGGDDIELGKTRDYGWGWFSPYTSHVIGGKGLGRSTWTHNWLQLGFTLPSQTFMHRTGFTIIFHLTIIMAT
jgi:hypothetical protein